MHLYIATYPYFDPFFPFLGVIAGSDGRSFLSCTAAKKESLTDNRNLAEFDAQNSKWNQKVTEDDIALIGCIQEDNTHTTFFTRPPLNDLTLFFEDERVEREYRRLAWKGLKSQEESKKSSLSPVLFDAYFDMGLVALFFIVVSIDSFWSYPLSYIWLGYFFFASLLLALAIFVMYKNLNKSEENKPEPFNLQQMYHRSGTQSRKTLVHKVSCQILVIAFLAISGQFSAFS